MSETTPISSASEQADLSAKIDKIFDSPTEGDRITFNLGRGAFTLIVRNGAVYWKSDSDILPWEIDYFRDYLIQNIQFVISVELAARPEKGYEIRERLRRELSQNIDRLHDHLETGDVIVFDFGMGAFRRTLIVDGDTVTYEEVAPRLLSYDIQQYRDYLVENVRNIVSVTLVGRGESLA